MAIRRFSTSKPGVKSNKFWDQDTQQGAMVPIASTTLTTTGDVYFTSIPQIYQDLFIVVNGRSNQTLATAGFFGGFNGNYGGNTNYSSTTLSGDGSNPSSFRQTSQPGLWGDGVLPATLSGSGIYGAMNMHILNYANTSAFKTYIMRSAADLNGSGITSLVTGLWRQTSAINLIYLTASISFQAGTTISLYGIKAGA
jgi:hypothetical protein